MPKKIEKTTTTAVVDIYADPTQMTEEAQKALQQEIADSKAWVDPLKPTYQSSAQFGSGKCKIGEWFINDQNLGNDIDIYIVTHGNMVEARVKGAGDFKDSISFHYSVTDYFRQPSFIDFQKKNAEYELTKGCYVLVFVPEIDGFGAFYGKTTLMSRTQRAIAEMVKSNNPCFKFHINAIEGKKYINFEATQIKEFDPSISAQRKREAIEKFFRVKKPEETTNVTASR